MEGCWERHPTDGLVEVKAPESKEWLLEWDIKKKGGNMGTVLVKRAWSHTGADYRYLRFVLGRLGGACKPRLSPP